MRDGRLTIEQARDVEFIAATCGLIHDLGNPPFGHAGEQAISGWFKSRVEHDSVLGSISKGQQTTDFEKFEGNAQTLRIVTRLQLLAHQHGLNLTVGTLSALMKYTAPSNQASKDGPHRFSKPGFFFSESKTVQEIRSRTGTGDSRNPITYLVEASDDLVYATVDIEDGVKKGVVRWRDVKAAVREHTEGSSRAIAQKLLLDAERYVKTATNLQGQARDEAAAQHFRTLVIGYAKPHVVQAFLNSYETVMSGEELPHGELIAASEAAGVIRALKMVARKHIYSSSETVRLEVMGRKVIHDLMDIFWEGAKAFSQSSSFSREFSGKIYQLMSTNYRRVFESAHSPGASDDAYTRLQLVCDYVCGMTDSFACNLHAKLRNERLGP